MKNYNILTFFLLQGLSLGQLVYALDIDVKPDEVPIWRGDISANYRIDYGDNVQGYYRFSDGRGFKHPNGIIRPADAGSIQFYILNKNYVNNPKKNYLTNKLNSHPILTKLWLDGTLFIEEFAISKNRTKILIHLPYPPNKIEVEVTFNTNKKYSFGVKIEAPSNTNKNYDARIHSYSLKSKQNRVQASGIRLIYRLCASS